MAEKKYNVAVVGATGLVGRTMLSIMEEYNLPVKKVYALASSRSVGARIPFKDSELIVSELETFDFSLAEIGLFSPGAPVSAIYAPQAADAGCVVIDNTSQFRYEDDIPLVVTEVNPHAIGDYKNQRIIANPNCSTIQMLVALNQFTMRLVLSALMCALIRLYQEPEKMRLRSLRNKQLIL